MSSPETVYPPQSFPYSTAFNVTGIGVITVSRPLKNPTLRSVNTRSAQATTKLAALASVKTITVV